MSNTSNRPAEDQRVANEEPDRIWVEPARSKASRRPAVRSRFSVRGHVVCPRSNREIVLESELERGVALGLISNRHVATFQEQPGAISYIDDTGVKRRHTPDFDVRMVDGSTHVMDVKPIAKLESSGIAERHRLISEQDQRFRGRMCIRTEEQISRSLTYNGRLIVWGLRHGKNASVDRVKAIVDTMKGEMTIQDLIEASQTDAAGFPAVLNLIGDGELDLTEPGRITHKSRVQRVCRSA